MRKQMGKSGITLPRITIAAAGMFMALLCGGSLLTGYGPKSLSFVSTAYALIGRPATPVSYAGVARRTTRRAVVATTPYR
jgi:hypothetical protein